MSEKVKAFNQVADIYDDWYEHPQGKQVFLAERDAVSHMLPESGLGLEVGSGTGAFVKGLEKTDRMIIGLDPSTEMVSKAKGKRVQSVLGYGSFSPFRNVFDFVYMVTVIEFLQDPKSTLASIRETCKQKSSFTLLFINSESSWGDLYRNIGSKGDPVFSHARLFTLGEIREVMVSTGYDILDEKGTLASDPMESVVGRELLDPSNKTGVIIVKARPTG